MRSKQWSSHDLERLQRVLPIRIATGVPMVIGSAIYWTQMRHWWLYTGLAALLVFAATAYVIGSVATWLYLWCQVKEVGRSVGTLFDRFVREFIFT